MMESAAERRARLARIMYILFYLMMAIQVVASILSTVVIAGLLIPLLSQLKNGSFQQSIRSQRSARSAGNSSYSTYNLYLVYLAFIDLAYLMTEITVESRVLKQDRTILSQPVWRWVNLPYWFANLWINAAIVHEVFALLRDSKNARQITQPSLTRVNLQAGGLMVGAALYLLLYVYADQIIAWGVPVEVWSVVMYSMLCIPILYVIGVTIFVQCKSYLPPSNGNTPRDKAVRGLALCFSRVILVFGIIWIPVFLLSFGLDFVFIYMEFVHWMIHLIAIECLMSLQPILTFCLILSKPDVKQYITDFITLKRKENPIANAPQEGESQGTGRTSLLGYSFSNVDDDDDSAVGHDSDEEQVETEDHDMEVGSTNYETHRVQQGAPAAVLATGEIVPASSS